MAAEFEDREQAIRACDNRPETFIAAVEAVCDAKQIADIKARLFPLPTLEEKLDALEQMKRDALRTGLDDRHPIITAIKAEMAAATAEK